MEGIVQNYGNHSNEESYSLSFILPAHGKILKSWTLISRIPSHELNSLSMSTICQWSQTHG